MSATDVVIVGAPRSGTNLLRDLLTSVSGVTTWPCDEINLIWHHGNRREDSDELTPEVARPRVRRYIRNRFDQVRRRGGPVVVEKTCANSLRIGFVRAVLPDARYVLITRDGLDAAASAMQRWRAPLDLRYTAAKARFVPASDVPAYAVRFARGQLRRRATRSADAVTTWWGPRPRDYRHLMERHPLDELCAIQWQRCVESARAGLVGLPDTRVRHVRYEELVRDPHGQLAAMSSFLGLPQVRLAPVDGVRATRVGRGRAVLGEEATARLERLVGPTLRELGYVG